MSSNVSDLIDELRSALRGTWALLTGKRNAGTYFDFSRYGLIGSFIGLLVANGIIIGFSARSASNPDTLSGLEMLASQTILYVCQILATWIVLRQLQKGDMFEAFVTADNWSTAIISLVFITPVFAIVVLANLGLFQGQGAVISDFATIMTFLTAITAFIVKINIARLIVELPALQIVMLIIAQAVGGFVGLMLLGAMFGVSVQ
ncbi:hypothetical protein [Pelagibacterium lentulum]|uniref:hypothetical protein n=1 Tax=Pelagibacterium lentulum TaxID=2029865 RepID=UPI000F8E449A|nr:hypothetical protein [Pelagibacterium lentulum]